MKFSPITDHCPLGTSLHVKKDVHGLAAGPKQYTEAEKMACSLDAMLNGCTCEVC